MLASAQGGAANGLHEWSLDVLHLHHNFFRNNIQSEMFDAWHKCRMTLLVLKYTAKELDKFSRRICIEAGLMFCERSNLDEISSYWPAHGQYFILPQELGNVSSNSPQFFSGMMKHLQIRNWCSLLFYHAEWETKLTLTWQMSIVAQLQGSWAL